MELNRIRYLFTAIGFPPCGSGPYTWAQKSRAEIHARRSIQITDTQNTKQDIQNNKK